MRRGLIAALFVGVACSVSLSDTLKYSCVNDSDCGGDGYKCAAPPGGAGRCCLPTGKETCNKIDDDCNGIADDGMPDETCNGKDDNCNGQIDETFNLMTDPFNCGACGNVCPQNGFCNAGLCRESMCTDGNDNDSDGKIDCADPDCNLARCGPGCECRALKKAEGNCNNEADDDGDAKIDCGDEDCAGAGCGDGGCTCAGLKKKEVSCGDSTDNDSDGMPDCADSDCSGELCQASPSTFRCSGNNCKCNGGAVVNETGIYCRDHLDNDCDGLVDCAEAACNNLTCNPDGGVGCLCQFGQATETDCADRRDNDGDAITDCADALPDGGGDCPTGTACTFLNTGGMVKPGTCAPDRTCK
jgi:hypothetical protein